MSWYSIKDTTPVEAKFFGNVDVDFAGLTNEFKDRFFNDGSYDLIIDMSEVNFISSSGVGFVAELYNIARKNNGRLVLLAPSTDVRQVFQETGILTMLHVAETVEEARELCL